MPPSVIETNAYKLQARTLLNQIQQQSIVTFLAHYPFEGDEIPVGNFTILSLLWDVEKNIRIGYVFVPKECTVFLLSVTKGDTEFQSPSADKKDTLLKKLGIGISTRLIAETLITLAKNIGEWFL
jgi:hypothetical protein